MTADPWPAPKPWTGGMCPTHGCHHREGCIECPPAGHPEYEGLRVRREWALARNAEQTA